MKIIFISGKAEHGKDTFANILKKEYITRNKRVLITHYGDLVKYVCRMFFNWDGEKNEPGRSLLQRIGTRFRSAIPTFWIDWIKSILQQFSDEWDVVLIPDCRFPNEVQELVPSAHHYHIRIIRENYKSKLTPEQLQHPSETALDDYPCDYKVINNTLEELAETAKMIADII